jgi:hypothetical protein
MEELKIAPRQCKNCGAAIFAGQRFCRFCGRPTEAYAKSEMPTQRMEPQSATTAPTYDPTTNPVPPLTVHSYAPRPGPSWAWIVVLIGIGLFAAGVLAIFILARVAHKTERHVSRIFPPATVNPPAVVQPGETILTEEGASISGDQTVITRTFPLSSSATFVLENVSGDIEVEGWDEPQAEVKVTKRGGSEKDRRSVQVMVSNDADKLAFRSDPSRAGFVKVDYEVRMPRSIKQVKIESSVSSIIKLRRIDGEVLVNLKAGNVKLSDVVGSTKVNVAAGNIAAVFENATSDQPLVLTTAAGNIEVQFKSVINADVEAETTLGKVEDDFGLSVEKRMVGQRAIGRIGSGGRPLILSTKMGNIKIRREGD